MSHTILLVQPNRRQDSRSYADFESVNEAMEGICKIYEEQLKKENSSHHSITYDIRYWAIYDVIIKNFSQLFDYIDNLTDLSVLVYQRASMAYAPYNKVLFQYRENSKLETLKYRIKLINFFYRSFTKKLLTCCEKWQIKSRLFDPFLQKFYKTPLWKLLYLRFPLTSVFRIGSKRKFTLCYESRRVSSNAM